MLYNRDVVFCFVWGDVVLYGIESSSEEAMCGIAMLFVGQRLLLV